jgi:hypothetical protein
MNVMSRLLFLKEKMIKDAIFRHATSRVSLWRVPLMFDNFLKCLTTPNSAVMPVSRYHSNGMLPHQKTHRIQENLITLNFLPHFLTNSLSTVTVGWFGVLPQLQFLCT